jgi:hypothetical protein
VQTFVLFVKEMLGRIASWLTQSIACTLAKTLAGRTSRKRSALLAVADPDVCRPNSFFDEQPARRFAARDSRTYRVVFDRKRIRVVDDPAHYARFFRSSFFSPTPIVIKPEYRQRPC